MRSLRVETVAELRYLPFFLQMWDEGRAAQLNWSNKMVTAIQSSLFR